jgi:peptidoglycan/LPS O-acetylase OafA/YrhL
MDNLEIGDVYFVALIWHLKNREVPGIVGIRAISSLMICIFHALMATENVEVAK